MSWRDNLTEEQRAAMGEIQSNLSHVRVGSSSTKFIRHENGEIVERERPGAVVSHSMFPYYSSSMAVDPGEVEQVQERLRLHGVMAEFDKQGRPVITSTKQHSALATALGMKTGRDGYGHVDEHGQFQSSGRKRNDEIQEGRTRVRKAREELMAMPDEVPAHAVDAVLDQYNIAPTDENTG